MHLTTFGEHPRKIPSDTKGIPAPSMLITITTTVNTVIQTAGLIALFQYPTIIAAALRGNRIE